MTEQELNRVIKEGETNKVEFKASMRFDFEEKRVNKELRKVISKTIAGFMNTAGGVLLIGVEDNGNIIGIQHDLDTLTKKNVDCYEQHLRNGIGVFLRSKY